MKIYHTATQEAYDNLLDELKSKGYRTLANTHWNDSDCRENTCVKTEPSHKTMVYSPLSFYRKNFSDTPIIEFHAGDKLDNDGNIIAALIPQDNINPDSEIQELKERIVLLEAIYEIDQATIKKLFKVNKLLKEHINQH